MPTILVFLLVFLSHFATAQETFAGRWEAYTLLGSSFEPKDTTTTKLLGSTTSSKSNDSPAFAWGAQFSYRFRPDFSFGIVGESTTFPRGSSDTMYFIGVLPEYSYFKNDSVRAWVGLGLGLARMQVGQSSAVANGIEVTLNNSNANALGFSPRAGVDFPISENLGLRIQLCYTQAKFDFDFKARNYPSGTTIGNGSVSIDRSWYTGYLALIGGF